MSVRISLCLSDLFFCLTVFLSFGSFPICHILRFCGHFVLVPSYKWEEPIARGFDYLSPPAMVFIFDGNSEIGAKERSNLYHLIGLRHLIKDFFPEIPIFLHACATCSELPSDISTMTPCIIWRYNPSNFNTEPITVCTMVLILDGN